MITQAQLQPFCYVDSDSYSYQFGNPFLVAGFVYATDGKACVRVAESDFEGTPATGGKYPPVDKLLAEHWAEGDWLPFPYELPEPDANVGGCDPCGNSGKIKCCECGHTRDCDDCGCTGKAWCLVYGQMIRKAEHRRLCGLPGLLVQPHEMNGGSGLRLKFDGGIGLVIGAMK